MFKNIKCGGDFKTVERLSKGWSLDEKYFVETKGGERLLLRISDIEQYDAKKKEYEIISKYSSLGFTMSLPVDFGIFNDGKNVYMLLTWVDGRDLEEILPKLPEAEQYKLGRTAGEILRKIHSIELAEEDIPKNTKKEKKLLQLLSYEESDLRIEGDEYAIKYVRSNIDRIWKHRPVYMHGDYHPGNLIYTSGGSIGVIDFNRWEVGDPYEEFYKLESFGTELSIPYCIGQIDSYFDDSVPENFWQALAVYVAHASLHSIKWAEKFGREDVEKMKRSCRRAFDDYDGFRLCVPRWYAEAGACRAKLWR